MLSNVILASQILAALVHHAMFHGIQFVIVQNRQLVIRLDNAYHQPLFENCANLAHAEVSFFYTFSIKNGFFGKRRENFSRENLKFFQEKTIFLRKNGSCFKKNEYFGGTD